MEALWKILRPEEQIELSLRKLYEQQHFHLYHLNNFEEYTIYQQHPNFLRDVDIITFTGNDGRMMALKPDATLPIVKNTGAGEKRRIYYVEDIYRHDRQAGEYQKISQVGLEVIDEISREMEIEVLALAWQSLALMGEGTLDLSHMGVLDAVFGYFPEADRPAVLAALRQKSSHGIRQITAASQLTIQQKSNLEKLVRLSGDFAACFEKAQTLLAVFPEALPALQELAAIRRQLLQVADLSDRIRLRLDFSIVNNADYYSGLLFQGFSQAAREALLFGGRYDNLLRRQGKPQGGIGFGMRVNAFNEGQDQQASAYLNIALPKGRMGTSIYQLLTKAGIASADLLEDNRKLIFVDEEKKLRFFLVKPSDVAIYVEHGAADLGVVGNDILEETAPEVIEFLDLGLGRCRLAVAAHKDFKADPDRPLRVATKYPKATRKYYEQLGQAVELIHLNGSIELAPLLDLADVIVDIVETGTTLRENDLVVQTEIFDSSARLVINPATWRFKQHEIETLIEKVRQQL